MLCILMIVQVLPIIDLVRGIPCAVTKRRHLRRALLQYLDEFDTCKCAPCPNNAKPVLSGTECKCMCQTGTFGTNCEIRAPDYTSGTAAICLVLESSHELLGGEWGNWLQVLVSQENLTFLCETLNNYQFFNYKYCWLMSSPLVFYVI